MSVECNCHYLIRMRQCWTTSIGHPDLLERSYSLPDYWQGGNMVHADHPGV